MAEPTLADLVGWSLTGTRISLGSPESAQQVIDALAASGWDATRLAGLRDAQAASGQPWPLPIAAGERGSIGAAQLFSATQAVIVALGLVPEPKLRDQHAPLSARDQALIADRPPHHGS